MVEPWLQGSMVVVFAWLVIGGLGVPLPEDVDHRWRDHANHAQLALVVAPCEGTFHAGS